MKTTTEVVVVRLEESCPPVNNADRLAAFVWSEFGRNAHEAWFAALKLGLRRKVGRA